jgi:hypothetical protein
MMVVVFADRYLQIVITFIHPSSFWRNTKTLLLSTNLYSKFISFLVLRILFDREFKDKSKIWDREINSRNVSIPAVSKHCLLQLLSNVNTCIHFLCQHTSCQQILSSCFLRIRDETPRLSGSKHANCGKNHQFSTSSRGSLCSYPFVNLRRLENTLLLPQQVASQISDYS